jgi:excisionase family DNA binding protein
MVEKMVSVEEAAEVLGLHPATVQRAIKRGELPATRVGRKWRIRPSDLEPRYHAEVSAPAAPTTKKGRFARLADEIAGTGARTPSK